MHGHGSANFYHCDVLFKYGHQNLLPTQKIHFTHLQQYDENHCTYHARIGRHSKKSWQKRDHWPRMDSTELFKWLDLQNLHK